MHKLNADVGDDDSGRAFVGCVDDKTCLCMHTAADCICVCGGSYSYHMQIKCKFLQSEVTA